MLGDLVYENDEYLIYEDDEGMVTLIMMGRGITMLFSPDEWCRFSVMLSIVSWGPCEN